MKPGTKSRKLGLQIPTVNPCNDFIVDYLIRNKIKSDKQVLCKSYLYNLAIQAVRKYPLPLICEEQLAALEGFGNFFISQVGRLIKKHYLRGRMPTEKQMQQDDQAHFQALRIKKKAADDKHLGKSYRQDEQDSPIFKNSSRQSNKVKFYRPKRNTEPMNILQAMLKLGAHEKAVTKGQINQVLFNEKKQKIRLWYVLKQKMQIYNFIQVDVKDEQFVYLTAKGRNYVLNYDKREQQKSSSKRRRGKKQQSEQQGDQYQQAIEQQKMQQASQKKESCLQPKQEQQQKTSKVKSKPKQKVITQVKTKQIYTEMAIKKIPFPKATKFESIDLLINQKDSDITDIESLLQKYEDISYQFCDIELADFIWTACEGKILDCMAIRIKEDQFDYEQFKTICFRSKMTGCQTIYLIIQSNKQGKQKNTKHEQSKMINEEKIQKKQQIINETQQQQRNYLLCEARNEGFKVYKTKNVQETMQLAREITKNIYNKLKAVDTMEQPKRNRREKASQQGEGVKYLGTLDKFNSKIGIPYQMGTITNQILKCIPDLSLKCIKILQQKFPTLHVMYKKSQDVGSTKQKKIFLKTYLINEKISDAPLNTLVQILFYEQY